MSSTFGRAARTFLPPAAVLAAFGAGLLAVGVPPAYALSGVGLLLVGVFVGVGHTPHSRFTVGSRGRVTESEVVRHVPCVDCGADAVWGRRREYRRELVVFGTPVWTLETGENVYCRTCVDDPAVTELATEASVEMER
jgi:hypothetical protein